MIKVDSTSKTIFEGIGKMIDAMVTDYGKFKMGDILKPASWRAPAKNSARGNVLEGGYAIQWTGPLYLR